MLYQRGLLPQATYVFKHALIQDAAYQSLLKRTRQQYHQHIAQVLVVQFPHRRDAARAAGASLHRGRPRSASRGYWQRGRASAAMRVRPMWKRWPTSPRGWRCWQTLSDIPARAPRELDLQLTLGQALAVTKGRGLRKSGMPARARERPPRGTPSPLRVSGD